MKKTLWVRMAAPLAVFALIAAACSSDTGDTTTTTTAAPAAAIETGTIVDVAAAAGSFETLLTAATAAGLAETLQSDGPFTVFAPTDEAFAALPEGTVESLLADPEALADILLYHVVSGEVLAADVVGLDSATTVQGSDVAISVDGSSVMVNESNVTATDIAASNGVIHVIDAVLIPAADGAAGEAMGDDMSSEDMSDGDMAAEAMGTIVDVAISAGTFETLLTAAEAAGLAETLQSDGPFTVFAPTDEAFAALPEGTVESLLADPEALADILLYHVVSGEVLAADVVGLDSATTVQGSDVAISVDGESVMVNDANVVATDIAASNGVIHVIDAVILPPTT